MPAMISITPNILIAKIGFAILRARKELSHLSFSHLKRRNPRSINIIPTTTLNMKGAKRE